MYLKTKLSLRIKAVQLRDMSGNQIVSQNSNFSTKVHVWNPNCILESQLFNQGVYLSYICIIYIAVLHERVNHTFLFIYSTDCIHNSPYFSFNIYSDVCPPCLSLDYSINITLRIKHWTTKLYKQLSW